MKQVFFRFFVKEIISRISFFAKLHIIDYTSVPNNVLNVHYIDSKFQSAFTYRSKEEIQSRGLEIRLDAIRSVDFFSF